MICEQDQIAHRAPNALVLLIVCRSSGALRPAPSGHEIFKRDLAITAIAEDLGDLLICQYDYSK